MVYKILEKIKLLDEVYIIDIEAPGIAENAKIGMFVNIKSSDCDNNISLRIIDYNKKRKIITVVLENVKGSIEKIKLLKEKDFIFDISGPSRIPYM